MAVLFTRTSTAMPTRRTVWLVIAVSYLVLLIDALPTTEQPTVTTRKPPKKPETLDLKSEDFSLRINLPSHPEGHTANSTKPEVIVKGQVVAEYTEIGRRLVVSFESDGVDNVVKFKLEPSLSIDTKIGAAALKVITG